MSSGPVVWKSTIAAALVCAGLLSGTVDAGATPASQSPGPMIRHIVLVEFKPGLPEAEIRATLDGLAALQDVVPGIAGFHSGPNVSPEGLGRGYSHVFVVDFESPQARDAYLDNPDHRAAGARLVANAQGGIDGILVFDVALPDD
ncbi:Dabb family protein [Kaustia mangrovi]|nr:Dabb family protein [Kaustia mangrovi]